MREPEKRVIEEDLSFTVPILYHTFEEMSTPFS